MSSSIPCCSIGLKRRVSGNGTLAGKERISSQLLLASLFLEEFSCECMYYFPEEVGTLYHTVS